MRGSCGLKALPVSAAASYLCGFVETRQPADLRRPFFGSVGAAERQQRPLSDQQHVPDVQVDVLLPLLLVVVERSVLKALRAHPDSSMASRKLTKQL